MNETKINTRDILNLFHFLVFVISVIFFLLLEKDYLFKILDFFNPEIVIRIYCGSIAACFVIPLLYSSFKNEKFFNKLDELGLTAFFKNGSFIRVIIFGTFLIVLSSLLFSLIFIDGLTIYSRIYVAFIFMVTLILGVGNTFASKIFDSMYKNLEKNELLESFLKIAMFLAGVILVGIAFGFLKL